MAKVKRDKDEIIHIINDLGRQMSTSTVVFHQAIAEKAGLSGTDHKYVDILFQHGSMTAGKLAEHTGLTTGAVTGVIDRLEKQGLVTRERNVDDRRQVLVVLQKEEALKRIGPSFQMMKTGLDELYRNIPEEDLLVIKNYLENVIKFYETQIRYLRQP